MAKADIVNAINATTSKSATITSMSATIYRVQYRECNIESAMKERYRDADFSRPLRSL